MSQRAQRARLGPFRLRPHSAGAPVTHANPVRGEECPTMNTLVPALAALQASEQRSLFQTMTSALPRDPASVVILVLCVAITIFVIVYGRKTAARDEEKK